MTSPSEPEPWDVAHVLQFVNPIVCRWSCPTVTKKNRRCENVVSRERCVKVTFMISSISLEDARVIARDRKRELTDLAEMMICPLHSSCGDSKEKVRGVVMQWKNYIKTSMCRQAQPPSLHTNTKPPTFNYQPTNGARARQFDGVPEAKATVPRGQSRIPKAAPDVSTPQVASPTYGTTINWERSEGTTEVFENLALLNAKLRDKSRKLRDESKKLRDESKKLRDENQKLRDENQKLWDESQKLRDESQKLRDENQKLRDENQLLEKGVAVGYRKMCFEATVIERNHLEKGDRTAREIKRARSELRAVEKERKALDKLAEERFHEINTLQYQAAVQLEKISSLQDNLHDTLRKTSSAHSRLSQIWTAASVRPM